ncbi:GNAT family N-acetyltransferase [Sphingomonas sp. NBWT7]|uniref:GNAT family N-acetyltransferase n=1 Tax=Sphingomonas sp. NBWT7 TaxID=2596913 RepID=UPI0016263B71|nr:GNAT family protein [Sphingomonas sp. NBWT7]QNE30884.1 GNAT family N-acetyltransferase [Sphingomonas sp. NBWT7]
MFARTKRLTLRPGWPEETNAIMAAIVRESAATLQAGLPCPHLSERAAAFLAVPHGATDARFLILSHECGYPRIVGGIGLIAHAPDKAELACWLMPAARGRGIASEAANAVIDMARHALPLRRLEANPHAGNVAALRLLAKLGFRNKGCSAAVPHGGGSARVTLVLDFEADSDPVRMPIAA